MLRTVLAASAATTLLALSPAEARAPRPNIIVVTLDDVPDALCDLGMTRVCNRMSEGRVYRNSFVNYPLCAPSRTTFLTGQEATTHGVLGDQSAIADHRGLLPAQLGRAGYTTGIFGKDPQGVAFGMGRIGFDDWAVLADRDDRYFDPAWDTPSGRVNDSGYTTDALYGRALDFIRDTPGRPYFAWVAAVGAHAPRDPKPSNVGACSGLAFPGADSPAFNEADLSDKPGWFRPPALDAGKEAKIAENWRTTCEVLRADDRWIARLIDLAGPDTVVVLTSDNGFMYGPHRLTGKLFCYEESIRVPLVVWGGPFAPGTDGRLVSNVDIPATILELADAEPGRALDGRSILGTPRARVRVTSQWGVNETAGDGGGLSACLVEAGWRLFDHLGGGGTELYDMASDPTQARSLAGAPDRRRRVERMRRTLQGERP